MAQSEGQERPKFRRALKWVVRLMPLALLGGVLSVLDFRMTVPPSKPQGAASASKLAADPAITVSGSTPVSGSEPVVLRPKPDVMLLLPFFPRRGTMFKMQGKVSLQRKDKSWWALEQSAPLNPLDAVTTKDDGQVAFEQFDGLTGFLDNNAIVRISDGKAPESWSLNQGRLLLNPARMHAVETPQAVVTISAGGVVYVLVDELKTVVSVAYGEVEVKDTLKRFPTQTVKTGQKTVVPRLGAPAPPIGDNRMLEISLMANRLGQVLEEDKSLRKMVRQKLGREKQRMADLIAVPSAPGTLAPAEVDLEKAGQQKQAAPTLPPPKPVQSQADNPVALAKAEQEAMQGLMSLRGAVAAWAFQHPGKTMPSDVTGALKPLMKQWPVHTLVGKRGGDVKTVCPLVCPHESTAAWLVCGQGGGLQWRANDKDGKGKDLCRS